MPRILQDKIEIPTVKRHSSQTVNVQPDKTETLHAIPAYAIQCPSDQLAYKYSKEYSIKRTISLHAVSIVGPYSSFNNFLRAQ